MNLAKDPINLPSEFFKLSIEEQNAACEWIKKNLVPIKSPNYKCSSYRLKHLCEREMPNGYISNGAFKGAMEKCGFTAYKTSEVNWYYNISKKSITKLYNEINKNY